MPVSKKYAGMKFQLQSRKMEITMLSGEAVDFIRPFDTSEQKFLDLDEPTVIEITEEMRIEDREVDSWLQGGMIAALPKRRRKAKADG